MMTHSTMVRVRVRVRVRWRAPMMTHRTMTTAGSFILEMIERTRG